MIQKHKTMNGNLIAEEKIHNEDSSIINLEDGADTLLIRPGPYPIMKTNFQQFSISKEKFILFPGPK